MDDKQLEISSHKSLCNLSGNYFNDLFEASLTIPTLVIEILIHIISPGDNQELLAPLFDQEYKETVFQMNSDKASGLDDLNPSFNKVSGISMVKMLVWLTEMAK